MEGMRGKAVGQANQFIPSVVRHSLLDVLIQF